MSVNLRLLLHENSTQCCLFFSILVVLFIADVQVGPGINQQGDNNLSCSTYMRA